MIDFYTWTTPNGRKVSILLEELGVDYEVHSINITQGDQNSPAFLKISPNNKIPAIIDRDNGMSLMESGAILVYLAEKYGKFLPKDRIARAEVNEWLMWQMGGFGPILGQAHHFLHFNPGKSDYAEERGFAAKWRGFMACSIGGLEGAIIFVTIIRLPIWPAGHGCRAMSGNRSILPIIQMSGHGISAFWHAMRCKKAIIVPKHMGVESRKADPVFFNHRLFRPMKPDGVRPLPPIMFETLICLMLAFGHLAIENHSVRLKGKQDEAYNYCAQSR